MLRTIILGPLAVRSYYLMMVTGFLAGLVTALWLAKREGLDLKMIMRVGAYLFIVSIIGAKLFYLLQTRELAIWSGGFSSFGTLIFSVIFLLIYTRWRKLDLWQLLDIAAPAAMIYYALARIGCFLNGCCCGIETTVPWAVRFPTATGLRHPTQLYSFLAGLLIFSILIFFWPRKKFTGQIFCAGLMLFSIYRFFNEFLRVGKLDDTHIATLVTFLFAFILYIYLRDKK